MNDRDLRCHSGHRKWTGAVSLVVFMVSVFAVYASVEYYRDRNYLSYFRDHKGRLASVVQSAPERRDDHLLHRITLRNDRGLEVRAVLKVPRAASPPHPAIITLGGLGSSVRALEYIQDTGDFVVLAMDFPFEGRRTRVSTMEFLGQLPAMRRAMLDTPPATMLGVDYLCQRPDVDRDRIILVGGSLGALVAPAVAAADQRIAVLALLFGAGDLPALVQANLPWPDPVRRPAAWLLSAVVSPMEPLKYIGQVAPRPVFMLNGTRDPRMPERCSRLLHEAAGEPKAIRWIPAGHVSIKDDRFRQRVLGEFREWLAEIGYLSYAPSQVMEGAPSSSFVAPVLQSGESLPPSPATDAMEQAYEDGVSSEGGWNSVMHLHHGRSMQDG